MRYEHNSRGHGRQAVARAVTGAALLVTLGACDSLLEVELPGNLVEDDLYQPASAQILINSVIADFECAYSMYSATISASEDATWKTSGYWSVYTEYQTLRPAGGACTANTDVGTDWFQGFQKSRLLAESAFDYLSSDDWASVPDRDRLRATAAVYAGLFYSTVGEVYCEYALPGQSIQTPTQMLEKAEEWMTTAIGIMGANDYEIISTTSLKQFAHLVRARVRLAMGDNTGAAADANEVQAGFVAYVTRDASVRPRWNAVHQAFNGTRWRSFAGPVWWYGVDDTQLVSAGYLDLTIGAGGMPTVDDGVADARVPVVYTGQFAQDGVTDQYMTEKYSSTGDWQRMATWAEAQFILAEVDGTAAGIRGYINAVRDTNGIDPLTAALTDDEAYSVLIEERRREFFLEGRHYADKLRYGLWFPRGQGFNHKQVRYGLQYCWLMPEDAYELNEGITAGYTGPDLSDPNYAFELKVSRVASWPVPSALPLQ
jgi:hypothetical protein